MRTVHENNIKTLGPFYCSTAVTQLVCRPVLGRLPPIAVTVVPRHLQSGLRILGINKGKGQPGHVVLQFFRCDRGLAVVLQRRLSIGLPQRHIRRLLHSDDKVSSHKKLQDLWWKHSCSNLNIGLIDLHPCSDPLHLGRILTVRRQDRLYLFLDVLTLRLPPYRQRTQHQEKREIQLFEVHLSAYLQEGDHKDRPYTSVPMSCGLIEILRFAQNDNIGDGR